MRALAHLVGRTESCSLRLFLFQQSQEFGVLVRHDAELLFAICLLDLYLLERGLGDLRTTLRLEDGFA